MINFSERAVLQFTVSIFLERISVCVCASFPFDFRGLEMGFDCISSRLLPVSLLYIRER